MKTNQVLGTLSTIALLFCLALQCSAQESNVNGRTLKARAKKRFDRPTLSELSGLRLPAQDGRRNTR